MPPRAQIGVSRVVEPRDRNPNPLTPEESDMAKQWREMYNEWEKAVAPGLQELTASDGFRDLMAAGAKVTSAFTAEFERASRRWLHFWNLPAATDVRRLRQQVASLDREIAGLKSAVFEVIAADPAAAGPSADAAQTGAAATPTAAGVSDLPKPDLSVVEQPTAQVV